MNRVTAAAITVATATMAAATMAAAAAAVPGTAATGAGTARLAAFAAAAAPRPGAAKVQAAPARPAAFPPAGIASELDHGKYVTVVHCHGATTPPPVRFGGPGTPLTLSGAGPSASAFALLKHHGPYKTVYTCTVTVSEKVPAKPRPAARKPRPAACEITASGAPGAPGAPGCTRKVTLNTGFGGMARQVRDHHPATWPRAPARLTAGAGGQ